jgi:putative intracellular protease/amidase
MEKAILYLYVFLDMNGFSYSYELAIIWLNSDAVKAVICGSSWMAARRVINILHSMLTTDIVDFSHVYRNGISGLDELPSWCRIPLEDFAALRAREKLNDATIKNDIYSILRFLQFLQKQEVHSFDRLTGKIVAEFNLEDHHGTSAGKNTCNARVRRFLKYLYRAGLTQDEKLHFALGSAAASREQIVQVLNNDEIKQIRQYIEAAASPIALRDSAIILLGADMGIRGSDIVSLKLSDIDWRNRRILLSQNKTGVEVCLAAVGGDRMIEGSHGIRFEADLLLEEADLSDADALFLPGGMPGAKHLDGSALVERYLKAAEAKGAYMAAICAAPMVLGRRGYLKGKKAVCYPGFEEYLLGADVQDSAVAVDGNVITGCGMGAAMAFGGVLIRMMKGAEKEEAILSAILADRV